MEPFLGQIFPFPYNFIPSGWAPCDGRLLPISQNEALFALIGTTFGGDGENTFALPNLIARIPIGSRQGPGLQNRILGDMGGTEAETLTQVQMPQHNHIAVQISSGAQPQTKKIATEDFLTMNGASDSDMEAITVNLSGTNPHQLSVAGGSQPHENESPYLVVNYCIALVGIFPSMA